MDLRERIAAIRERYGDPKPPNTGWQGPELELAAEYLAAYFPGGGKGGYLEIGSANGISFATWGLVIPDGPKISVDLADKTCTWTDRLPLETRNRYWGEDLGKGTVAIVGDSRDQSTVDMVAKVLDGRLVDFLFIDGDHSYVGAKSDFDLYSRFVRKGGLIGFHDVAHPGHVQDVVQLWKELSEGRPDAVFLDTTLGTGILVKDWD